LQKRVREPGGRAVWAPAALASSSQF
jgi:hypothetical protein